MIPGFQSGVFHRLTQRQARPRKESPTERYCFAALIAIVAVAFIFGGSARDDVPGLMVLFPLCVLLTGGAFAMDAVRRWHDVRTPMIVLAVLAGWMVLQLVPLPPQIWLGLPRMKDFARGLVEAGVGMPWHGISIAPDLTLSSLVSLAVPMAALVLFAGISKRHVRWLLWIFMAAIVGSALLGAAQYAAGPDSVYYLYRIAGRADIVGVFANRNHQALFLVAGFPIAAALIVLSGLAKRSPYGAMAVAAIMSLFLMLMLLLAGSRASLGLAVIAIGFSVLILRGSISIPRRRRTQRFWISVSAIAIVVSSLLAFSVTADRMPAIDRLLSMSLEADRRAQSLQTLWVIIQDFWLFGSGFGTFDPLFRTYEPDALLQDTFFNHAHNDMVELLITGGLPALLIAVAFSVWLLPRLWIAVRSTSESSERVLALVSAAIIVLTAASSLVDYPLRTPMHMLLFSISVGWLARAESTLRSVGR